MNSTESEEKKKQKDMHCIFDTLEAYTSMLSGEGGDDAGDWIVDPTWESKPIHRDYFSSRNGNSVNSVYQLSSKSEQRKWKHDADMQWLMPHGYLNAY